MDTKSFTTTASVNELKEYARQVDRMFCPVCTVTGCRPVFHNGDDEKGWSCFSRRCLRCSLRKHRYDACQMFRQDPDFWGGCHSCSLAEIEREYIHIPEYGKRSCRYKKLLILGMVSWENKEFRDRMVAELPGLLNVKDEVLE